MIYKKGDVILLPFPFTNGTANKKRPALVISNLSHHAQYDKIICLAITSQGGIKKRYEYRVMDTSKAGLILDPSWVLPDKTFTTENQFIIKKLGELDQGELSDIMKMFEKIIN